MSQTAEFKSIIIKIWGSEKQESDLLFIFFYFIWCTRTHTQGLHRYEVVKNNNSILPPSKKWPNLPLFPPLIGKQSIQPGKAVQQILTPHGKTNLHSPTQGPGKASHPGGWETSDKGKKPQVWLHSQPNSATSPEPGHFWFEIIPGHTG